MTSSYILSGGEHLTAEYDPRRCELKVIHNGRSYVYSSERGPSLDITVAGECRTLYFHQAHSVYIREYRYDDGDALWAQYSDFYLGDKHLPFTIGTWIRLRGSESSVEFELEIQQDEQKQVRQVRYPSSMLFNCEDPNAYTILPMMQGTMIPAKWKNTVMTYSGCRYYERDAYMPWWGQAWTGEAYQCICETPWDAGYFLEHIPSGSTTVGSVWYPSLGKMAYRRKCRFYFYENGDYNDFCHNYRRYIEQKGELLTLQEKIRRTPSLAERIGRSLVHDYLFVRNEKDSPLYRKRMPQMNEYYCSFPERWAQIEALMQKGAHSFIVHMDGCGNRGYDNGHPDLFPINSQIGGAEEMKSFVQRCRENGLFFDIHDQYRDYYFNSPSFQESQAIFDSQQNLPIVSLWQGGKQSFLCATQAMDYLRRNMALFDQHGITFDGLHLGSFAGDSIDECYNPLHPMTKRECISARKELFAFAHSRGMVVGSDEPVDCFLSSMDMASHAPYSLSPSLWNGIGNGIPIPLFNLVYHDAVLFYWINYPASMGGWGIPNNDRYFSHAILNANPVYMLIDANEEEIHLCQAIERISKHLAFTRMVKHEFLNDSYRCQRTTFADGTTIEVDFDENTYTITPDIRS